MNQEHQNWGVESLWEELEPQLPGLSIEVLASVGSTNTALIERLRKDEQQHRDDSRSSRDNPYGRRQYDLQPCLLVAEQQTHGRGRMGRVWHSSPGASLTFSLALPLTVPDWSGLSLVVGCAIAEALEPGTDAAPQLQLKWPNDLWLDGRKLGGLLIETVPVGNRRMAVVGVGLNITPDAANPDANFATGFACLNELLPGLDAPAVLKRVAPALLAALNGFASGGFAAWQAAFARRDLLAGKNVTAGNQEGQALGVNARGELLLQTAQGVQAIIGGEVSVRLNEQSSEQ
jgi:BirA family biotin operon repressor/biotin-[acetyl-CoA-carboxylase] ligase